MNIMPSYTQPPSRRRLATSTGRSLIELMVAILIGSLILAGVLIATSSASSSGQRTSALGRLNESGQVALQVMAQDVRMAGFGKPFYLFEAGRITKQFATAGIRGCDGTFSNLSGAAQLTDLTCPDTGSAKTSGSFVVTYEADSYNAVPVASTEGLGDVPSDCTGAGLRRATSAAFGNQNNQADQENTNAWLWRVENRYFIDKDTDGTVALRCRGNGGAVPFSNAVTIVRGVERMVVTYGIATGAIDPDRSDEQLVLQKGLVAFKTAKEIDSDANWSKEPAAVRWQRVVSTRICLEIVGDVGSADRTADQDFGSYRDCTGTNTKIEDGRQRRAVTMTMNLRNKTPVPKDGVLGYGNV